MRVQCPVEHCSYIVNKSSTSAQFLADHSILDVTIEQYVDEGVN